MTGSTGGPGDHGRKRPAPTIDLTATEVDPGSPQAGAGWRGTPGRTWLSPTFAWPIAGALVAGVVLTLIVLAAAGMFAGGAGDSVSLEPRLARMEKQVREFAARPASVAGDPKAVDDLATRLRKLESIAATPKGATGDPALTKRLATLEGNIQALGEKIGVVAQRNDEIAALAAKAGSRAEDVAAGLAEQKKASSEPRADIEALSNRIAALERTAKSIESELARRAGGEVVSDRALRRIVVANVLVAAVDRGAPFAAELEAATSLAPDPKALAPLAPFAARGLPSPDVLARELVALIPALAKAIGTAPREGGLLDRLKANAERIVRVRPIDDTGDDPAAILQRIEARAAQRDLAGAMAELAKLPEPARAVAKEWTAKVEARSAAIEASRRFSAGALDAAGKPSL